MFLSFLILVLVLLPENSFGRVWKVPEEVQRIQQVVRLAQWGDTINIAPGIYAEQNIIIDRHLVIQTPGLVTIRHSRQNPFFPIMTVGGDFFLWLENFRFENGIWAPALLITNGVRIYGQNLRFESYTSEPENLGVMHITRDSYVHFIDVQFSDWGKSFCVWEEDCSGYIALTPGHEPIPYRTEGVIIDMGAVPTMDLSWGQIKNLPWDGWD